MIMKFGEGAIQLISDSWLFAKAFKCETIGSEFLLLAMCNLNCPAKNILEVQGITDEKVIECIERNERTTMQKPSDEEIASIDFEEGLHACRVDTKRVLAEADIVANRFGDGIVTPEHILSVLASKRSFTAAKIMIYLNADLEAIRQQTLAVIMGSGDDDYMEGGSSEDSPRQSAANLARMGSKKSAKGKHPTLDKFGKNLTQLAKDGKIDPVIGREEEINRVMQILARRTKNNPCLVGEPGVGKTAIAEGLALKIAEGDVPDILKGKTVFNIEVGSMVAGSKFRGDFEERIQKVLDEASSNEDIILFIDEIHTLVGAGDGGNGSLDAANIMKPMLTKGELQIIGATTLDEYSKIIEKDSALERRFQKVLIEEPSQADAILILKGLRPRYEEHHKIKISDEAIEQAVLLSTRYLSDRFLPDKAIDLIDEAAAKKRINFQVSTELNTLTNRLAEVGNLKKVAAEKMEFEKAQELHVQEQEIEKRIEELKNSNKPDNDGFTGELTVEDIAEVLAKWSGIPVSKITESDAEKLKTLEDELKSRVIGQDEAVSAIARAIRRSRLGLKDPKRPSGSFIFLGTTGVGKTELARALAEVMFGNENALVRIDMSEYMEKHDVSKLIGSPPGYVGYDEGGQLTEKIRRHPYSVVLFDEIEKAHPDIFNSMLQILDDGRLTDGKGRLVDFKNTIIIMTSNIGARMLTAEASRKIGFELEDENDKDDLSRERLYGGKNYEDAKKTVLDELKKSFSPEFINRVDEIIFFRMLNKESILKIVDLLMKNVGKRVNDLGIEIKLTEQAKELLAKKGYDPQYGARPLRRVIQAMVEDKFSEALLDGIIAPGDVALVDCVNDEIVITCDETKIESVVHN
ncbi:MAG: ATP-dependent Clp protease ATP-binding subunit [Clostridiales bacterium]|nr:ATP-dependent Clp protease ATP-binding subunit [Clostridiales bacterium]